MSNQNEIQVVLEKYHVAVKKLYNIHKNMGGGKARSGSGLVFENFIENICDLHNLVAKKNDYKRTKEIKGISLKNLQVDKHIYKKNIMTKAVESKAYLDSCYLKRAVMDFIELHFSPDVPNNVQYGILAGQECVSLDSWNYYTAYFKEMTGKDLNIFIINKKKKRNANKAIYMKEHNEDFQLDMEEINKFMKWINE